jgi:hypothetical protein
MLHSSYFLRKPFLGKENKAGVPQNGFIWSEK